MRPQRQAFTLSETVLAFFLLSGVLLVVVRLMHVMLQYQVRAERQVLAAAAAEKVIEEMRAVALTPAGFQSLAATYDATTRTFPDFPGIAVTAWVQPYATLSPCQTLEAGFANPRQFDQSLLLVQAVANFNGRSVQVTSLVGEPRRTPGVLSVSVTGPTTLAVMGTTDLSASLDGGGGLLEDVTFHWSVEPVVPTPGNATVTTLARSGSQARLQNVYTAPDGSPLQVPGTVRVSARAHYRGREYQGQSVVITLL